MSKTRSSGQWRGWLYVAPALLFVAVFVVIPFGQLIVMSMTDRSLLGGGKFIGLMNYIRIWNDSGFWRALLFTVKYTIVLTPILMILGFALALLTADNTPLKRLTRTVVFLPVVIGLSSSSLLWFWLFDEQVGLFNKLLVDLRVIAQPIVWFASADLAFWAVVISITWKVVGFGMVLFIAAIQSIDREILEAAVIDGAGYWRRAFLIIVPLSRRIILLATLVSAIGSMLAFDQFYIMTSGGPRGQTFTAVYWIYQNSFVSFRLGYGAALSIVLTLIILAFSTLQIGLTARRRGDMTTAALAPEAAAVATRRAVTPAAYVAVAISIAVIAIMAAPIVLSALASIKTAADASAIPPHYLPRVLSLENYAKVVGFQAGLATYVGNSALVAAMTIAACLALAAPAGYGLARFAMRGKEIAFLILLAPIMIPYQALLTPLYLDFAKVGLVNTHIGLAIVHTILQLPFSIFLMRASFEAIPREIEEAAVIDGCSTWQRLTRVFLPLAVPGLVTVALFAFINSWNEFLAALIFMNRNTSFTVPILLVSVRAGKFGAVDWGALQASVIISIIPSLAVYLALQRYYISGLLSGAVK